MGNHDDILIVQDGWANGVVPEGEDSIDCNLEGFSAWESICWQVGVLWGKSWMPLVIDVERGWWDIIASSPLKDLLFSVLSCCLGLVEALKSSVMALVKSPVLMMWNPPNIELICNSVICLYSSLQNRGVAYIKIETFFFQHLTGFNCLSNSMLR